MVELGFVVHAACVILCHPFVGNYGTYLIALSTSDEVEFTNSDES